MRSRRKIWAMIAVSVLALTACKPGASDPAAAATSPGSGCPGGNGGLRLPPGFCATIFADHVGHARHLAVAAGGTVYANSWSGSYYAGKPAAKGAFIVAMRDGNGDGVADRIERFGTPAERGGTGGTGIALFDGAVFVEEGDRILRYALAPGSALPARAPQVVLADMPLGGDHPMHPFVIDAKGQLFVDMGSATNSCQLQNRQPLSPGHQPCTEKLTRGGIWRYAAGRTGQRFSAQERYVSGIRNGEGLAFDGAGHLFATQHGRDQLGENWAKLYTARQGVELPAEELMRLEPGNDYGWPECYYDGAQHKLVLAPEYGGDGKAVGGCATRTPPIAAFPAHWAPDDLLIYQGDHLPAAWRGGAFIAFHGSWNRAPAVQGGYNIVFQPLAGGKASGPWVVFADGFAGAERTPDGAAHRPAGLAEGPDGAIYVSDDVGGRIWRITYRGDGSDRIAAAPAAAAIAGSTQALPADAGLTPPPGVSPAQIALGRRIFHGQASGGTCSGCHGANAGGSTMGPPLNQGPWLWSDGSLAGLRDTIKQGVPRPKKYSGVMPPLGGAALSDRDLDAVAAYVWAVGHSHPS